MQTVRDTLRLHIAHQDLTVYNAVQKLLYIVVILAGISQVVTGLALWKPVQLSEVVALLGGFQTVRFLHFTGVTIIVGFLVVYVALALLVPRTLLAMIGGGPQLRPQPAPAGMETARWRLELAGLIADKRPWTLPQLAALPEREIVIRHVCVEGWDYIGQWSGVPLRSFLERVGADLTAKYVAFKTADDYPSSIDMASALHPQTEPPRVCRRLQLMRG